MVFDLLRRKTRAAEPPVQQKASAAARVVNWHGLGGVSWSPRDAVSRGRIDGEPSFLHACWSSTPGPLWPMPRLLQGLHLHHRQLFLLMQ